MHKHRGFPSRLPGTDYQFTIRRDNPKGATKIIARERYADRSPKDREADINFLACLWEAFGEEPFVRGNLDAGRLSWLIGREVIASDEPFDPASYDARLKIDVFCRSKIVSRRHQIADKKTAVPKYRRLLIQ